MPTKKTPHIHDLPSEILIQILSSLSCKELLVVCVRVCKHWRNVVYCPLLWKNIELRRLDGGNLPLFQDFLDRCPAVHSLSLRGKKIDCFCLRKALKCFFSLRRLDVYLNDLDLPLLILNVAEFLPGLEELLLREEIPVTSTNKVKCPIELTPLHRLVRLKELYIHTRTSTVNDESLKKLAERCSCLEKLHLSELNVTDETICELLCTLRKTLRHIHLEGPQLTDSAIIALKQCGRLESLSVVASPRFTEEALCIIRSNQSLKCLSLDNTGPLRAYDSETLAAFFSEGSMKHLSSLKLSTHWFGDNDSVIYNMAENCSGLQELSLNVMFVKEGLYNIKSLCLLTHLELYLLGSGQSEILEDVFCGNEMSSLRCIKLFGNFDDYLVKAIALCCTKLESLILQDYGRINNCRVSDKSLQHVTTRCLHLRHLDVFIRDYTGRFLENIASNLKNLERLRITAGKYTDTTSLEILTAKLKKVLPALDCSLICADCV